MQKILKKFIAFLAICGATGTALAQDATITIDASKRFQIMSGWEVVARGWEYDKDGNRFDGDWFRDTALHDTIMDALIDDAGINRVRIELRTGAENPVDYWSMFEKGEISYEEMKRHFYHKVQDNSDPRAADPGGFQFSFLDFQVEQVIKPMAERLEARGEKLYINLCVVDFKSPSDQLSDISLADNPREYGELVAEAMKHLRARHDIVPDALEIMLEPENTERWRGPQLGQAAAAAIRRLGELDMQPEILLPSVANAPNAVQFYEEAIRVPGVARRTAAIAYHRYGSHKPEVMGGIRNAARRYGVRTEMLEFVNATLDDLFEDLTIAHASAFNIFSISSYVQADQEAEQVGLWKGSRQMAQYFRYVRMGAQRIGAVTDNASFLGLAFENPAGGLYAGRVLVIRTEEKGLVAIRGLVPDRYAISYTDDRATSAPLPGFDVVPGERVRLDLPGKAVVTIYPDAE